MKEKLRSAVDNNKKFFSPTYFQRERKSKLYLWMRKENLSTFSTITESFVLKQLKALRSNKAVGLDRISARLFKVRLSVWHLY